MERKIIAEIHSFITGSPENRFLEGDGSYFDEPLVGFAAADDPLFGTYKEIIGDFHLTPRELTREYAGSEPWLPASVICWVLPISREARESNRREARYPSRRWAQTRTFGEKLNGSLRRHLVAWLGSRGHRALAPQYSPLWQEFADSPVGVASAWSERHAAYAAGLGTFSLTDAFITPRGVAHRLGTVITDLPLAPTGRPYPDHRHNCLWYREGSCGACIGRCPVGALSPDGHDKGRCREYVYGEVPRAVAELYAAPQCGCGLCQTGVPCEEMIP